MLQSCGLSFSDFSCGSLIFEAALACPPTACAGRGADFALEVADLAAVPLFGRMDVGPGPETAAAVNCIGHQQRKANQQQLGSPTGHGAMVPMCFNKLLGAKWIALDLQYEKNFVSIVVWCL